MSMPITRTRLAACVTALFILVPAVATAQGAGAGPGPGGAQVTTALTTFQTADFSGSGICAMCHSRLTDQEPKDVSNDAHWRSTMMANAAKDPLWQAKISSEVARAPHVQPVIEDKCSRCHMGMARYQAVTDGTPVEVLEPGFLDPNHELHEAAMDGVSCTLCHQIKPDLLGTPDSYTGKYVIDTSTSPPNRLIYGPYHNPLGNPMRQAAGFDPAFGAQVYDSAHCGSCHTLYTPVLDANGDPIPVPGTDPVEYVEFPEQTTYLEWEHSAVAETCQDCHLPRAKGRVVISNRPPRLAAREPFWQHHFVGGNSFMVGLLRDNADVLGVTADLGHLNNTITRTETQLAGDTAQLTVATDRGVDLLTVTVDVVNLAGHKLPSGLPSRRAWLHLQVTDDGGAVVFESGRPKGDGRIEGNDAGRDPSTWEPHHDLITLPDQVQIYEPIMLTYEGDVTYTLLRAHSYAKDNRLLPAGFDKTTAGPDIAVHGVPADEENFQGGSDRVVYEIGIGAVSGTLQVTVKLLFQSLSIPFVDDLAQTDTELVTRFMGMYKRGANTPVELAQAQKTVP
jgi:hypothetical protein